MASTTSRAGGTRSRPRRVAALYRTELALGTNPCRHASNVYGAQPGPGIESGRAPQATHWTTAYRPQPPIDTPTTVAELSRGAGAVSPSRVQSENRKTRPRREASDTPAGSDPQRNTLSTLLCLSSSAMVLPAPKPSLVLRLPPTTVTPRSAPSKSAGTEITEPKASNATPSHPPLKPIVSRASGHNLRSSVSESTGPIGPSDSG